MSSPVSRLPEILDATARVALLEIPEVASAYAAGSGLVAHPRIPGETIAPWIGEPTEPFQHVTEVPLSGDLPLNAMQGTHVLTWTIPMRLYVGRGIGLEEVRKHLVSFAPRYIAAFSKHVTLEQTARRWFGMSFAIGTNDTWAWLEIRIRVDERLNLATEA